jgi:hypothetical protein
MNKKSVYRKSLLVVLVLASGVVTAKLLTSNRTHANPSPGPEAIARSLDSKARLAKSGDESTVQELADEVINRLGGPEAAEALSPFKDRLVRAEMNYRRGQQGGISEQKLANSLNQLGRDLGLSESARVSPRQLRYLRVHMMAAFPNYVSQSSDKQRGKSIIANDLSPLEAAGLSLVVISKKQSNDNFGLAPKAWAAAKHKEAVAKWEAHRKGKAETERKAVRTRISVDDTAKNQFQQAFDAHADEATQLIDRFLTGIGMRKETNR